MLRLRHVLSIIFLLCVSSCALPTIDSGSATWDDINYAKVACGKDMNSGACKYDEDAADTGRRGGKGK